MNWATVITILISAAALIFTVWKSTAANVASRAKLTQSNENLTKSLDEFKTTSRAEHTEFREKLDKDSSLLAEHDTKITEHERRLNDHENRINLIFQRGGKNQ